MLLKTLTTMLLTVVVTLGNSQVVASINTATEYTSYNTASVDNQLSYAIVNADTNIQFSKVQYSTTSQKLTLDALEEIESISLIKAGGEFYLTRMPIISKNLRLSLENYEAGDYEIHLMVKGKSVPTIIQIHKI